MNHSLQGQTRERVFQFVHDRLLAGDPPTVREVQQVFGFRTPQTARYHLEKLVANGRLVAARGKARGYRLLESFKPPSPIHWAPLLGRVQAGPLTTATENLEGYVPVSTAAPSDHLFALRVQGESMIGAGILPNDVVIVRRQSTADSGAVVVALVAVAVALCSESGWCLRATLFWVRTAYCSWTSLSIFHQGNHEDAE